MQAPVTLQPMTPLMPADYLRQPDSKRSWATGQDRALGGALGAAVGAILACCLPEVSIPLGLVGMAIGGVPGLAVGELMGESANKRNKPLLITENGQQKTVYVSKNQLDVMARSIADGFRYPGVPLAQFDRAPDGTRVDPRRPDRQEALAGKAINSH